LKHVNKILLIFILVITAAVAVIWQLIEGKKFAEFLSTKINQKITRYVGFDISFDRMKIKVFPPASVFQNVVVKNKDSSNGLGVLDLKAEQLGIYFDFFDFFSNRLSVRKVLVENGSLNVAEIKQKEQVYKTWNYKNIDKEIIKKTYRAYDNLVRKRLALPLKEVIFEKIKTVFGENSVYLDHFSISALKGKLETDGRMREFKFSPEIAAMLPPLNEFSFEIYGNEQKIKIKELNLDTERGHYQLNGEVFEGKTSLGVKGGLLFEGTLADLPFVAAAGDVLKKLQGDGVLKVNIENELADPNINFELKTGVITSPWIKIDSLDVIGQYADNLLKIINVHLFKDQSHLASVSPVTVANVTTKKWLPLEWRWQATAVSMEHIFSFFGDDLNFMRGQINGNFEIKYSPDQEKLDIDIDPGLTVSDFHIFNPQSKTDIIVQPILTGHAKSNVSIAKWDKVALDLNITYAETQLKLLGSVVNDDLNIKIDSVNADLKKLGKIASVNLTGNGALSVNISDLGSGHTIIKILPKLDNFGVLGYVFGNFAGELAIDVDLHKLTVLSASGKNKDSNYQAIGTIDWTKEVELALDFRFDNATFKDSLTTYAPITDMIKNYIPSGVDFTYDAEYHVSGKPEKKIKVDGRLMGKNIQLYQEDAESLNVNFVFDGQVLKLTDVLLKKGRGKVVGTFLYDISSSYMEHDFSANNLQLRDFRYYQYLNAGIDGDVGGEFYANGTVKDFSSRCQLRLTNSHIKDFALPDSILTIFSNPKDLFVNANIWGDRVVMDGSANLGNRAESNSYFNLNINFDDIKLLLGAISGHNLYRQDLSGALNGDVKANFDWKKWRNGNLKINLNKFEFNKGKLKIGTSRPENIIVIENGVVKKDEIDLSNYENKLTLRAAGDLNKKFSVSLDYILDASIWEIVTPQVLKSEGKISGKSLIEIDETDQQIHHDSLGDDIYVKFQNFPIPLEKIKYSLNYDQGVWSLQRFQGQLGRGYVDLSGKIVPSLKNLLVDMVLRFDNVFIPFMKKSSITTSGKLMLKGEYPPYTLNGSMLLINGELLDDLGQFGKVKSSEDYQRFLPIESQGVFANLVEADITVNSSRPLAIKNNFFDMKVLANGKLNGNILRPAIEGDITVQPDVSKFIFKGHEFSTAEGKLSFNSRKKQNSSEIKYIGNAKINEYDVRLDVFGSLDQIDAQLSSRPALAQEDLLSLVTLGLTPDISRSLNQQERDSVASVGVGNLLVEQLKLNQGLRSSLGVKVSVSPEFTESDSSMLSGISSGSEATAARLHSTTKIKVQKQLHDKVDLSVSSTVGGTTPQQKQEMNLNYNLNKNMSVQGVYEMKNTNSETTGESANSSGVDLKWRWSFK
jgi:translocation and assembly module TamB